MPLEYSTIDEIVTVIRDDVPLDDDTLRSIRAAITQGSDDYRIDPPFHYGAVRPTQAPVPGVDYAVVVAVDGVPVQA